MEPVHGTHKASKLAPEDRISCLPDNVVTNILDRLPTNEAVRTDILSRSWRFKWTLLTQLVFDHCMFFHLRGNKREKKSDYDGRNLSRLFYYLKGPITKFVLYMENSVFSHEDVNRWILYLSRKGIKELTLQNGLKLATELYSCMELNHLNLNNCVLRHTPSFHGFPNLLTLDLAYETFVGFTCSEFIAQYPLLEILIIGTYGTRSKVNLVEIRKLVNLKMLSLRFDAVEGTLFSRISSSSVFQFTCLPKLQELHLNFFSTEILAEDGAQQKVPTAFLCLKTLKLSDVNFTRDMMLLFVIEMICVSPNLQTLEIQGSWGSYPPSSKPCSLDLDCNKMQKLQLRSVVLEGFMGLENEVCLIKFILGCSPFLGKFIIRLNFCFTSNYTHGMKNIETEKLEIYWEFCQKLLKLHRASPTAEIDIRKFK